MKTVNNLMAPLVALAVAGCAPEGASDRLAAFRDLPEEADPVRVGQMVCRQFLSSEPENYRPEGCSASVPYGNGENVIYAVVSLWVNALEFARNSGNAELEKSLIEHFEPFFGPKRHLCSRDNHVDFSVFGAIPLEIFILNGDERAREMGMRYADHQWEMPDPDALGGNGNKDYDTQVAFLNDGFSPQSRMWIEDMYMMSTLQLRAYRATGDISYVTRIARETAYYLGEMQLESGLFHHSSSAPFTWARGNGWMAGAMPAILSMLPEDSEYFEPILKGYRLMMSALLENQHESGMWGQLVDCPGAWDESSGSAMFTYSMVEGLRHGWLDAEVYGPAARRAWIALCRRLDSNGNISDVCDGTDVNPDMQFYLDRPHINGAPHGQAAMLWIANALVRE